MYDSYKITNNISSSNLSKNLNEIKEEKYPYKNYNNNNNYNYNSNLNSNPNVYNSYKSLNTKNINLVSNDRYGVTNSNNSFSENDNVMQSTNIPLKKNIINISGSKFFSKVIIENLASPKKAISLLERFLLQNNYDTNYGVDEGRDRIEFTFCEEEIAFNFTKLIHQQKSRTPSFYNIDVHLSLIPNKNFLKGGDSPSRRRGLSPDSIQRLFNGLGVISKNKEEKKMFKINGNLDLGISSPFLYPHEKKKLRAKNKSVVLTENNKKNNNDINEKGILNDKSNSNNYENNGFEGEKLKDYTRLPIRVLDTFYSPKPKKYFLRPEERERWVSPSNFKY